MIDEREYLRMQLAVIQADALHTKQAEEIEKLKAQLDGAARGAKDLLEACGAAADVEEGRDPIEAARAVRTELVQTHDRANAAAKRLTTAVWLLERIDKIQPKALGGDVRNFLRVDNDFSHVTGPVPWVTQLRPLLDDGLPGPVSSFTLTLPALGNPRREEALAVIRAALATQGLELVERGTEAIPGVDIPGPEDMLGPEQAVLEAARDYATADMPSHGTKLALLDAARALRRELKP